MANDVRFAHAGDATRDDAFVPDAAQFAVAQAVRNATQSRQFVAVLRVRICPVGVHLAWSEGWYRVLARLAGRFVRRADDWGPIPDGPNGFILVVGNIDGRLGALVRANELVTAFDSPTTIDRRSYPFTVAIGVSVFPDDGNGAEELLESAAAALEEIRRCGQSTASFQLRRSGAESAHRYPVARPENWGIAGAHA